MTLSLRSTGCLWSFLRLSCDVHREATPSSGTDTSERSAREALHPASQRPVLILTAKTSPTMAIYIHVYIYIAETKLSFLPSFLPPSSSVMKMNGDQKVQSCFDPPVCHLASPQTRQPHHSGSRTAPLQSTAAAETLKTGSPSGPSRLPGGRSFFHCKFFFIFFQRKKKKFFQMTSSWRCGVCP